eukprot:m.266446 g.266446  ORF g.266446 m.266446 type:complete len:520 (-) comp17629_c0_seq4:5530-7089(-)
MAELKHVLLLFCILQSVSTSMYELGDSSRITPVLLDQERLSRRAICRQFDAIVINTRDRSSLHTSWTQDYLKDANANEGFTGNVAACQAGDISSSFRNAVVHRTNYIRALCHLPKVDLDCEDSDKCQAAALMMAANNRLSHFPETSWTCYSQDGKDAAGASNIGLGPSGLYAVDLYLDDPGSNNAAVGHRRWILWPKLAAIGYGYATGPGTRPGNAMWVIGNRGAQPTSPSFVAWPAEGYFPSPLIPSSQRWSLGVSDGDVSNMQAGVISQGSLLQATMEPFSNFIGDSTRAFLVPGDRVTTSHDELHRVVISQVELAGDSDLVVEYDVVVTSMEATRQEYAWKQAFVSSCQPGCRRQVAYECMGLDGKVTERSFCNAASEPTTDSISCEMAGCDNCDCVVDLHFRDANADFAARRAFEALLTIVPDIDIHTLIAPMDLQAGTKPNTVPGITLRVLSPSLARDALRDSLIANQSDFEAVYGSSISIDEPLEDVDDPRDSKGSSNKKSNMVSLLASCLLS